VLAGERNSDGLFVNVVVGLVLFGVDQDFCVERDYEVQLVVVLVVLDFSQVEQYAHGVHGLQMGVGLLAVEVAVEEELLLIEVEQYLRLLAFHRQRQGFVVHSQLYDYQLDQLLGHLECFRQQLVTAHKILLLVL